MFPQKWGTAPRLPPDMGGLMQNTRINDIWKENLSPTVNYLIGCLFKLHCSVIGKLLLAKRGRWVLMLHQAEDGAKGWCCWCSRAAPCWEQSQGLPRAGHGPLPASHPAPNPSAEPSWGILPKRPEL